MDMDGSIIEILAVDLNPFHLECERDTDIDKICQLESRSLASVGWHASPQSVSLPLLYPRHAADRGDVDVKSCKLC